MDGLRLLELIEEYLAEREWQRSGELVVPGRPLEEIGADVERALRTEPGATPR